MTHHHARNAAALAGSVLVALAATACSAGTDSSGTGAAAASATSSAATQSAPRPAAGDIHAPDAVAHTAAPTVSTRSDGALGKVLVTSKGLTLYLFQADKTTKSTCTGACAQAWPPLVVKGTPTAGTGVQDKLLSTTTRSDGTKQVTYKGHPLYRFAGDKKPGDVNGQGLNNFGAKWYVLGGNGKQITTSPSQQPSGGY